MKRYATGGGILSILRILSIFGVLNICGILGVLGGFLNAIELNTISNCNNNTSDCTINGGYKDKSIENHNSLSLQKIEIKTQLLDFINYGTLTLSEYIKISDSGNSVKNFINYGDITTTSKYSLDTTNTGNGGFEHIYNYGTMSGYVYIAGGESSPTHIHNYGEMGGAIKAGNGGNQTIYVNNFGTMNLCENGNNSNECTKRSHFNKISHLVFQNYKMTIKVDSAKFNTFDGNATDNSHIVLNDVTSVSFADKDSKIILDFGGDFELGKGYLLDKLVVDTEGKNKLQVDLSRLTTRSDIYYISKNGDNFIVNLQPKSSAIGSLYKSNVRAMNNFDLISNSMIFPYKYGTKRNANKRRVMRKAESSQSLESTNKSLESLESLESNAFFAYKSDNSTNRTRRRITTNRSTQNTTQSTNQTTQNTNQTSQTDKYYFLLTPFVTHNYFFQSGRYNLSGLEYGFITAFGGKISPSNYLGAHFMMSYGSLGDAKDKDFSITNLNLNAGLHYKLEMIWDMYLKARGDFYYFLNQAKTLFIPNAIKPNNLGFGVSVAYGKNFNFGDGGDLGVEVGIDYKGLQTTRITIDGVDKTTSETYQKSLYNLIYADLGLNYAKYFGGFGINVGVGIKGNVTANKLAKSTIQINQLNRSVDMILDNDNFLGYANAGIGYVLNAKNFDMEFSLAYYGNFGDRIISNGGGFEWRVVW